MWGYKKTINGERFHNSPKGVENLQINVCVKIEENSAGGGGVTMNKTKKTASLSCSRQGILAHTRYQKNGKIAEDLCENGAKKNTELAADRAGWLHFKRSKGRFKDGNLPDVAESWI